MQESLFERSLFAPLAAVFLILGLASCGAGKIAYTDRVKVLGESAMSPQLSELAKTLEKTSDEKADALVLTWHEWLGERTVPLVNGDNVTFVYYDFSHSAKEVSLLANFAANTPESLERIGKTHLYYRVYSVPRREKLQYHYQVTLSDNSKSTPGDAFNPLAFPGNPNRFFLPDLTVTSGLRNYIDAQIEPQLQTQNLVLYVPPYYLRNLARSYPVVYLVGMPEGAWDSAVEQTLQKQDTSPLIIVSINPNSQILRQAQPLERLILDSVKPWVDLHYRTLSDKENTVIVGWDQWAAVSQEVANAKPDVFGKHWIPQESTLDVWNQSIPDVLHRFFPMEVP